MHTCPGWNLIKYIKSFNKNVTFIMKWIKVAWYERGSWCPYQFSIENQTHLNDTSFRDFRVAQDRNKNYWFPIYSPFNKWRRMRRHCQLPTRQKFLIPHSAFSSHFRHMHHCTYTDLYYYLFTFRISSIICCKHN